MTDAVEATGDPLDDPRMRWAVNGLLEASPGMSASTTFTRRQLVVISLATAVTVLWLLVAPTGTAIVLLAALTIVFGGIVAFRWVCFVVGLRGGGTVTVTDEEARSVPDADLPRYTILLPAFREPGIAADVMAGVGRLDYPRDKLEVLLLLEADDVDTVGAAMEATDLRDLVQICALPPCEPRTKPKACNWGLYGATGELVTIYDAEDSPEPLQLRRAVVAFERLGPDYACLQGRLAYHNHRQNLLTRLFSLEYDVWFNNLLPGLAGLDLPLPLGGTSNHLRTAVVREVHGWDPYNVTEDADLGMRLNRLGHRSAVLDSETMEEANSDVINWVKQRSRWQKGYLQTGLVHLRDGGQLRRQLGWRRFIGFLLLVFGTPLFAVCNGLMWTVTAIWWLGTPTALAGLYPEWILHPGMAVAVIGNVATAYAHLVVATRGPRPHLAWVAPLLPLYWLLMAVAAMKAMIQLITAPSYWEKTTHGLHRPQA